MERLIVLRQPPALVLDGTERIADIAQAVEQWLDALPDLRVVVGSRHVLGLTEEHILELLRLDEDAATELVARRIGAVVPGFPADATNRESASAIAGVLEGHPLAIVVAAPRARLMSPGELVERLRAERSAPGGDRIEPGFARVIGAAVSLLAEPERTALLALSTLDSPAPLAVAEALVESVRVADVDRAAPVLA